MSSSSMARLSMLSSSEGVTTLKLSSASSNSSSAACTAHPHAKATPKQQQSHQGLD
jgi:hypothetical protein